MTGVLCPVPILQFFDNQGNLAVGGSVLTQVGGINAPTYSDVNLTIPLPNPIPLNSRGEASTAAGATSQVFLTPNTVYQFTISDANGNVLDTPLYVNGVQVSQATIGALLYPQTAAEIAAGVTPSAYQYYYGNVLRYGADPTGTTDSTAAVMAGVSVAAVVGGTVFIPQGSYTLTPGLVSVPANVIIRGAGKRATVFNATANGTATLFVLGGTAATNYYGCGLTDLSVLWTGLTGTVVWAQGTVGAEIARLYIEGETRTSGRLTAGVIIDGMNASSFYNKIDSVECNHFHTGFTETTTGTTVSTENLFINCNATGDVSTDTTSVGMFFNAACGGGTVLVECDFESCNYGVDIGGSVSGSGVGPITFVGLRGESNTGADVILRANINACTFIGSQLASSTPITDNSGTGNRKSRFIGTFAGSTPDQLYSTNFVANSATDIPITVQGYPAQTSPAIQIVNNTGVSVVQLMESGSIGIFGTTPPANRTYGFGTPTGGSVINNFNGASATLVQC